MMRYNDWMTKEWFRTPIITNFREFPDTLFENNDASIQGDKKDAVIK